LAPRDYIDALRRRSPEGGGDGACLTRSGRTMDLELYKFDSCPYCQRVYRAVRQLGVPLRYRDIEEDDAAARKLVEVGGIDQVPCLFVDGKPLYESADIVAFLELHFGVPRAESGLRDGR
jgi:glutaredoxin